LSSSEPRPKMLDKASHNRISYRTTSVRLVSINSQCARTAGLPLHLGATRHIRRRGRSMTDVQYGQYIAGIDVYQARLKVKTTLGQVDPMPMFPGRRVRRDLCELVVGSDEEPTILRPTQFRDLEQGVCIRVFCLKYPLVSRHPITHRSAGFRQGIRVFAGSPRSAATATWHRRRAACRARCARTSAALD
jgi:hypothetical protein